MATVRRTSRVSGTLEKNPTLSTYVSRYEAQPTQTRPFDAQSAIFAGHPPTGWQTSWDRSRNKLLP